MGRARGMVIQAGIESKYKGEFWCEVISTATNFPRATTKGGCVKPLNQLLLCLWSEEGVGVVFGLVLREREGPKAVGETQSGEYWLIVMVDGDGVFVEGCRAVVVT